MTTPNLTDRERDARDSVWLWCGDKERTGAEWDAALDAYRTAILASRDTAWRAAIKGMRLGAHRAWCSQYDNERCDCGKAQWNAALSALADRMTEKPNE